MKIKIKAFTLVEMIITIALVVILSTLSVPIYRKHVVSAKKAEGYALFARIREAEMVYFSEYKVFYIGGQTAYDKVLGIDARGNKYFTSFNIKWGPVNFYAFNVLSYGKNDAGSVSFVYNMTEGATTL